MATNESGHVVNANNFVEKVNVIGRNLAEYKPSNESITFEVLSPLKDSVSKSIDNVSTARNTFITVAAARKECYEQMDLLAKRAINIFAGSSATASEIKQGKALLAKYNSERVKDIPDEDELKAKAVVNGEDPKPVKKVSVSQQGYANKLGHFRNIVLFLKSIAAYTPNEEELKVEALEAFATKADTLNKQRNKAAGDWALAIETRNKLMYAEETGAYALSTKIMTYVAGSQLKNSAFYKELQKYPVRSIKV